jgi:hypothetical protein
MTSLVSFFRCNALVSHLNDKNEIMDDSDRCCRQHSDCYTVAAAAHCEPAQITYYSVLYRDKVSCMDVDNTCEHRICGCDKLMAECLKGHQETFNEKFKNLTKDQCHGKFYTRALVTTSRLIFCYSCQLQCSL